MFFNNLLIFRFVLLNLGGFALLNLAYQNGYVTEAYEGDKTWISTSIVSLFLVGISMLAYRLVETSRMLNSLWAKTPNRKATEFLLIMGRRSEMKTLEIVRAKLVSRVAPIAYISYVLVTLGFLGTVWGLKEALGGVNPSEVGESASIAPMVAQLIAGMKIAVYTTVVGIIFAIWLGFNVKLLQGGQTRFYTKLLEYGG